MKRVTSGYADNTGVERHFYVIYSNGTEDLSEEKHFADYQRAMKFLKRFPVD
jgi:hypothetical protein